MATTDARPIAHKNVAAHFGFPIFDADGDLVAGASSLDSEVSTDSGGFADASSEAIEEATSSGMYELAMTAGEMNGNIVMIIVKSTEGKTTPMVIYPEEAGDIRVNLTEWLDVAPLALVAQRVNTSVGAMAANVLTAAAINALAFTTAKFAVGYLDATLVATDAIDADAVAADAIDLIWDEPVVGHTTPQTYGQLINGLGFTGEVADVGALAGDFDVDGFTEATNDHFNGMVLMFTEGALIGQARVITDYTGAGQNCVFAEPFTNAPADNDNFVILPMGVIAGANISVVDRLFNSILDQSTGQLDAGSLAAATIAAGTFATDAIDANAQADDFVDGIWDEAIVEAASIPAATASFRDALSAQFALAFNEVRQTATVQTLRNRADSGTIGTAGVSDDATTATRDSYV